MPRVETGIKAACDLASDPNLAQRVQQFAYKPAPGELLLKPKAKHKKPAKDADTSP
jgi:hypothetical protein